MQKQAMILALIAVSFASDAQISHAAGSAAVQQIAVVKQEMLSLRKAELTYDAATADKLLADDFTLTTTDGTVITKQEFLKIVADRSNPLELFEYSEMKIRVYDTTAVVSARLHEKGYLAGKPYELNGRPTWIWVRQKGTWVCVAAHD